MTALNSHRSDGQLTFTASHVLNQPEITKCMVELKNLISQYTKYQ